MKHVLIEVGVGGIADCDQQQQQDEVATDPVIFVQLLPIFDTAQHRLWDVKLGKPNQPLDDDEDECYQAQDAMWVLETSFWMAGLVHFDDNEPSDKSYSAGQVQGKVHMSPLRLLFGCRSWLKQQNGLRREEDTGRHEQLRTCQLCSPLQVVPQSATV